MNRASIIPRTQLDSYNISLGSGNARINNRGLEWRFDAEISMFIPLKDTALSISLIEGNAGTYRHTPPSMVNIECRYYFVEDLGQPYGHAFIHGSNRIPTDENEIGIGLYVFRKLNEYEHYIDLLRYEEPLYLHFNCEINEDESHYRSGGQGFDILPVDQLQIRGLCDVYLRTTAEEVGEEEHKS